MPLFRAVRIAVLFASIGYAGREAPAAAESRPNIVIFLADDLGYGDLACYGHPRILTPNLDRFAEQGMRFTQCYSASAVCSPSRSAILTGRTPYRNGVFTWIPENSEIHLRASEISLATLLREQGYSTCHTGKWHLNGKFNSPVQPQPGDHGYDHWFATQNNAAPSHKNPNNFVRDGVEAGPLEGFSATLVAEEAVRWLKEGRDPAKPFYLAVWTHEPHLPIESDPRFMALYPGLDDPDLVQHHANITQVDNAFGMLMEALDAIGVAQNTFVFFTSDNGPEGDGLRSRTRGSTGGLRSRKRSVYEGGIRVPGIARWPGHIEPGSESAEPVIGSDLFATACALAGAALPADRPIDGVNLAPAFRGQPLERPIPMYWRCHLAPEDFKVAMRIGDIKILADAELTRFEMYNLARDPQETADLADGEPELFARMKARLIALQAEILAEGPDWWKGYQEKKPANAVAPRAANPLEGRDETGDFSVTRGGTIRAGELGYVLEAAGEAFAVKRLETPIESGAVFRLRYRALNQTKVKNAMLAFGAKPTNAGLIKAGTRIGLGDHAVFAGGWSAKAAGTLKADFDPNRIFEAVIRVDLKRQTVAVSVDGQEFEAPLPVPLDKIEYLGYYAKETKTAFSPIEIEIMAEAK